MNTDLSANTPLLDLLDHMEDTYADRLMLLGDLVNYRGFVEEYIERAVQSARKRGASWSEVAACLGVSKQAAQQRYGA